MTKEERTALRVYSSGLLNFGAGIFSSFLVSVYFTPPQNLTKNLWWFGILVFALVTSLVVSGAKGREVT
ncbi:MAG TPA: hypothetical protein VFL51_13675 [Pseudolabrys sp.]|nr:hypothetical protein [Pseudolabrys sp.]